ncbi:MAG: SagB/ThcOx family dehydrogenase [Burkholderiales bacterium]|nr:SagB/ThcOx family dehydrogenase [Burkholderiales bacterium]
MTVFSYHERTKHRLERYAAGPETLDWSMQPNPFREFIGAKKTALPLSAHRISAGERPALESVGALLQLSMGLSAWKEYGPDRWALRCNPSSGNLHPTECYILALNVPGIENGLHHYASLDHSLELRCGVEWTRETRLFVGLSSIHWREAWKYGERAFRYCQLDIGHALGALRHAALALGWGLKMLDTPETVLGTERLEDFAGAEKEEFDILLEAGSGCATDFPELEMTNWTGQANCLDPHPMYKWPVIDEVAAATRHPLPHENPPSAGYSGAIYPVDLLLGRRSAQQFDPAFTMKKEHFFRMLEQLVRLWDIWDFESRVHPVFFLHRVEAMAPGLYVLPRSDTALSKLKAHFRSDFLWEQAGHDLYLLARGDFRAVAKTVSCRQAIASDSCFAMGMLAEFEETIGPDPWRYRQLHWEAGLMGHALYLEAEAAGLRGTGIGCFFDDAFHDLLGLSGKTFQSLYHFTVGMPLVDSRILTLPPYPKGE